MSKFYAVRKGHAPGIYTTWQECEANVKGFAGAEYKSFQTEDEARTYLSPKVKSQHEQEQSVPEEILSDEDFDNLKMQAHEYLDFLHNHKLIMPEIYEKANRQIDLHIKVKKTHQQVMEKRDWKPFPSEVTVYVDGSYNATSDEYGYGVYIDDGEKQRILYGRGACEAGGRNVEGEVAGAKAALEFISLNPHYKSVKLYHDYQGVGSWADHDWKANKAYTNAYARFVDKCRERGLDIDFIHVDGHTGVEGNEYVDKLAKIACGMSLTAKEEQFISKLQDVPGYPKTRELPELDAPNEYSLVGDYMPKDF